jgi:predicted small secreted protein
MKNLIALIAIALTVTCLSACHTMKGLGQDISAGGQDLTKAAEKHTN